MPQAPQRRHALTVGRAAAIVIGTVVGVGIFRTPALVAANASDEVAFLALWLAGGVVSLVGGLCYAELAAANPNVGGEYHFLSRAFGRSTGFVFAWCRMAVIQTGAIAAVAFVFGDYATQLVPLGPFAPALYASAAIVVFTWINLLGRSPSTLTQVVLTGGTLLALAAVAAAGLTAAPPSPQLAAPAGGVVTVAGAAMIFVLLTYGGWNEAAYLSGELRNVQRDMLRLLVVSIGVITLLYLALNVAYLRGIGLEGIRDADVVAAELLRRTMGNEAALVVSLLVAAATLSTLNAAVFTGARTNYAMGRDHALLRPLAEWDARRQAPARALWLQAGIAVALVAFGSVTRDGFATMVEFTAPAFWLFLLLTGLSLFVLRWREPDAPRPFRVPFYPVTPAIFCATSAFMLHASIMHTGIGALVGVALAASAVPFLLLARRREIARGAALPPSE